MNAFHIIGIITAVYAVLVGFLGIRNHDFPSRGAEKILGAVSLLLVLGAVSAAIITAANEEEERGGGAEEATKSESH